MTVLRREIVGKKENGTASVVELVGMLSGLASLVVALVALFIANEAWTRPFPPDPTQVPTWGIGQSEAAKDQRAIEGPADAEAFFAFLGENAGRKVRIVTTLGPYFNRSTDGTWLEPEESGFSAPSPDCEGQPLLDLVGFTSGDPACEFFYSLLVDDVGPDRHGMVYQDGSWHLRGYFASLGPIAMHMGFHEYSITPLTAIEAVS